MRWVGVDESGKGDYFGYLVVAGVVVDEGTAERLRKMGVRDSKRVSDNEVKRLAKIIEKTCKNKIVKISPEKYNQLYKNFKNLNRLLAWGHATVIANLMEDGIDFVIVDKFADEKVLKEIILSNPKFENLRKKKIIQKVRGESDMAVAAASILARAEFLATLRSLSREVGVILPKGATHVDDTIAEIRKKYSDEVFRSIAKLHFKTTRKAMKK